MVMNRQRTPRLKPRPGYRPSRLHGGHTMAEGSGDRLPSPSTTMSPMRVARTRRPRRLSPSDTRRCAGRTTRQESWAIPLLSLQWLMKYAVHLGGESALDMAGYAHYLSLGGRSRVQFYGEVPSWLKRLPMQTDIVVRRRTLFGDDLLGIDDANPGAAATRPMVDVPWRWPLKTSSGSRHPRGPRRAAAECDLREPRQGLRGAGVAPTQDDSWNS